MFHSIPQPVFDRMRYLEHLDAADRDDGTSLKRRLRQITPDTGRFLSMLAAGSPPGRMIEIGTSAGYSALWLSLALRSTGRTLTTYELSPDKAALARETFTVAGVDDVIEMVEGDARPHLAGMADVAFCFLDADKEVYAECYEAVVPKLTSGGWLVADNALSHNDDLQPMLDRALSDPRTDAVIVPIGKGELVCRKARSASAP
jgi:predicted O-methyltransferase YrrM